MYVSRQYTVGVSAESGNKFIAQLLREHMY